MATYTTNFNLAKPEQNEAVDVDVLNNNSDIIDDNLGQAKQLASNIGYGYNNTVPYLVGDYCVYENNLYRCIQAVTLPENFDVSKWQQCNLANELQNIKGNPNNTATETLTKLQIGTNIYQIEEGANDNIADAYDATSTYSVGDYVIYHSVLYKCTTAVSSAEPFDSTKWTSCLVTDEMGQGGGGSGGHTILNDSGTALTQRDDLQFVGVYSEDDGTNSKTKVNIVREMTKAQFDLLSSAEKKGVIVTTDEPTYSGQYGETVLSSTATTLGSGATINLSDDYTNYDAIYIDFQPINSEIAWARNCVIRLVSDIVLNTDYCGYSEFYNYNYGISYKFTDADTISAQAMSPSNADMKINKIVGIKFGGSGSGGSTLPDVTSTDNGKILGVDNGEWNVVEAPSGGYSITTTEVDTGMKLGTSTIYAKSFSAGTVSANSSIVYDATMNPLYGFVKYAAGGCPISIYRNTSSGYICYGENPRFSGVTYTDVIIYYTR